MIEQPTVQDYTELLRIWEESVRSTHHFLTERDIQFYKPLVLHDYFPAVELYILRNDSGRIAAFIGLSADCIEMLFVDPAEQGRGYGKRLIEFATREKRISKVDVNEQNEAALHFYLNRGFEVVSQSAVDGMGKPFPILHMQMKRFYADFKNQ